MGYIEPAINVDSVNAQTSDSSLNEDLQTINAIEAIPLILQVVTRVTGMGFAAVARVTDSRWFACAIIDNIDFGLKPGGELQLETTICHEICQSGKAVIIDEVVADPVYVEHPTPKLYGFQSYVSFPIVCRDGKIFGTLCAIDPMPRKLNSPEIIGIFKLFAELIAFHIDAGRSVASSEANLLDERKTAELREQFIAILGHDLRNPLASISAGTELLLRTPLSDKGKRFVVMMQASVTRMTGLISNVLDFARGRLGGGLIAKRDPGAALKPDLAQVVEEMRIGRNDVKIDAHFDFEDPVSCDSARIAQAFSNLLSNAITHGAAHGPIHVHAGKSRDHFELNVENSGPTISPTTMTRLFQPFARTDASSNHQGLGLGLFIASEIAKAHGGAVTAESNAAITRFTLRLPLG